MVSAIQSGSSLSTDMLAQMRERMFARLDSNGDGQIDANELAAMTESGDQGKMPDDLAQRLKEADADGDGVITREEFEAMAPPEKPAMMFDQATVAQMREQMFSGLDTNGDGQIDAEELAALAENGDQSGIPDDLAEHLKEADSDGDGVITREEFEAMTPPERPPMNQAVSTLYSAESSGAQASSGYGSLLDIMN